LTRNQHILFRCGSLIASVEGAEIFAKKAAKHLAGEGHDKSDARFNAQALAVMSRVWARQAATWVAEDGLRWVRGSDGVADGELGAFVEALRLPEIHRAQAGLLADMDQVANVLYGRT
jgi:alkylation response protein AidB-like acyl-CoA dehydrogenase